MSAYEEESQPLLASQFSVTTYSDEHSTENDKLSGDSLHFYWHVSRRRYFWRALIIIMMMLGVLGLGFLIYIINTDSNCEYCDDDHTFEVYELGSYYECLEFDDDTYFTADVCSVYDNIECYTNNGTSHACVNSTWCDYFCSSYCAEGEGAICFIDTVTVRGVTFMHFCRSSLL